jgi:hypothetical protein
MFKLTPGASPPADPFTRGVTSVLISQGAKGKHPLRPAAYMGCPHSIASAVGYGLIPDLEISPKKSFKPQRHHPLTS